MTNCEKTSQGHSVGSLTDKTEDDVLTAMLSLAVREENIMVARVALNNMHQNHDEPIRSSALLKGQAGVCKYITPYPGCNREVDYTEQILRDVLSRGVADPDIQLELLSHINQNMTLEEVLKFVQTKEAGKRSATGLLDHNNTSAIRSQYKGERRRSNPEQRSKRHLLNARIVEAKVMEDQKCL